MIIWQTELTHQILIKNTKKTTPNQTTKPHNKKGDIFKLLKKGTLQKQKK